MSMSGVSRIIETVVSQKAASWGVSALCHTGVLWALMQSPGTTFDERPRLDGRPSAIVLQATMTSEPPSNAPEIEVLLDMDVTVGPARVKIARSELLPVVDAPQPTAIEPPEIAAPETEMPAVQSEPTEGSPVEEETSASSPPRPQDDSAGSPVSAAAIGVKPSTLPSPVHNPPPIYPPRAHAENLEGRVVLSLEIDLDGRVRSVEVASSSGHAILDAAAVRAVRAWRFEPARLDGQPVAWSGKLPVRFVLE